MVKLQFTKVGEFGEFIGVNFTVKLYPSPFLKVSLYPGVELIGQTGVKFHIDYINDMEYTNSWQTLTNITLPAERFIYFDTNIVGGTRRFYRAIQLP